jgi:predicted restriction endonuclease
MVTNSEWEAIKKIHGNRCIICRRTNEDVGGLVQAHLKAKSKNGTQVIPMCSVCHKKFDKGLLTDSQLKKIGIDPKKIAIHLPKKATTSTKPKTAYEEYQKAQNETAKKIKKANDNTKKLFGFK